MRLAVLSDIHANEPALEAVLGDISTREIDETWCLGDVVGYGAQPDGCVKRVFESCTAKLAGNHDLAVLEALDISSFSPAAADAVYWTRDNISKESLELLGTLKPADESRDPAIYHASPRDPVWEYVLWPEQAGECMGKQTTRVSLVGHSHVALCFSTPEDGGDDPEATRGAQAPGGTQLDISEGRWLLNPGSVGQPRDGDPRAAWLELDTEAWTAHYRRIPYEVDLAAESIRMAGLPDHLARRLYVGQ
jgi:predicted phosphodiesterase